MKLPSCVITTPLSLDLPVLMLYHCTVSGLSQSSTAKLSVSLRVLSSILDLESCHYHYSTSDGCSTQLTRTLLLYGLSVEFSIQYCILGLVGITEHLWSDDNRRYLIIFKVL